MPAPSQSPRPTGPPGPPTDSGPAAASDRGLLARRWSHALPTLALFVGLAVVNTYPLAVTPRTTIGRHGDALFSVWRLAWVAHQLRTDPARLFDANIFYPER